MSEGRCRWNIADTASGVRYDLPGCIGGAEYGPNGCTCAVKRSREDLEERVEALEEMVRKLTSSRLKSTPSLNAEIAGMNQGDSA